MSPKKHFVRGDPIAPPFPEGLDTAVLGEGCIWGAERAKITTEIAALREFYYAEDYHQQYLATLRRILRFGRHRCRVSHRVGAGRIGEQAISLPGVVPC